ncbi:MarR family winged helix-turn-helix transcriptional regulator [Actinomyces sp. oral taxon 414]|uniref:MarR family winged helix-turn-helix transcriptional regulator n=1 Tax=Actinomyces sp. oral taxon 414 TaxID=712122 RepID=UPI00155DC6B4|nr:MarR family transcriptional regulator [Actinomyces sp. oral taxon 414]
MDTIRTGLHERLHRLHRLMRRRHMGRRRGGPLADTTRGRGRVLAALQMHSPIPTRELAYLLDIRQQSLNELLQKLEADGLVERRPSPTDRRVMLIHLTEAGRDAKLGDEAVDYLSSLTDEEAASLMALLDKVIAALEEQVGADDGDPDEWMAEARRRMGDEPFEAMMRMREHGFGPGPFGGPGPGPFGGHGHGHGRGCGRGFGPRPFDGPEPFDDGGPGPFGDPGPFGGPECGPEPRGRAEHREFHRQMRRARAQARRAGFRARRAWTRARRREDRE